MINSDNQGSNAMVILIVGGGGFSVNTEYGTINEQE